MWFPHGHFFPRAISIGVWDWVPFSAPTRRVWSPGYFVQWVVLTPDGGQTAVAASTPWQAEGEMSVIDPFIVTSFYYLFNSPKKVFSFWILENLWDAGRTFDQEDFPHVFQMSYRQTREELKSLEEAPSV